MRAYADEELAKAAGRIWTEGRANPIDWVIRTLLGTFTTDDRATWCTETDGWTAELRRSKNGRHWFPLCSRPVSIAGATTAQAGMRPRTASGFATCAPTSYHSLPDARASYRLKHGHAFTRRRCAGGRPVRSPGRTDGVHTAVQSEHA